MLELTVFNEKFWEMVAFIIFFVLVGKKIYKVAVDMVVENVENIKKQLSDAEIVAFDAGKLLEDVNNADMNLAKKTDMIVEEANKKASNYAEKFNEKLYLQFKIAEKSFANYLTIEKERQIEKIKYEMLNKSVFVVEQLIKTKMVEKDHENLIDSAILNFEKSLNSIKN